MKKFAILMIILGIGSCGSSNGNREINNGNDQVAEADSHTFYISPNGSDSNLGSLEKPWKTFSFAITKLHPGDTLILKNGTYTKTTTGLPYINCGNNARNGSAGSPITVKAENERQAFLQSDGSVAALRIEHCSYYDIIGLRGASADLSSANGGAQYSVFDLQDDDHINLKRLLASNNNRYFNTHPIGIGASSDILIEESEVYSFHRHGIDCFNSHNCTMRRNYVNSRGYADLAGAYPSNPPNRGDEGIICYTSDGCIFDNDISEGNDRFSFGRGGSTDPPNKVYGSIVIDDVTGFFDFSEDNTVNLSKNDLVENSVAVNSRIGTYDRGVVGKNVKNVTIYNGNGSGGAMADENGNQTQQITNPSITYTNVLSFNNKGNEFSIVTSEYTGSNWLIEYSNAGGGSYLPSETIGDLSGNIRRSLNVAPTNMGLGTNQCIVYVPGGDDGNGYTNPLVNGQSSNMAGAGKNGEDIGANIVYRYHDGVLTDQKLWDQTTGEFPCGATVEGVNDDYSFPFSSCVNVHKRLNVGVNGCPIP